MSNETVVAPVIDVVLDVNGCLTVGADTLEMAVTLTPKGFEEFSNIPVDQNIIFLGDVSGSMVQPATKLMYMKQAMSDAVLMLTERVWFAVVTFSDSARAIVELCPATPENKKMAIERIARIAEEGGTQMSKGLAAALAQHKKRPNAAGLCIMLTDGANNDDDETLLENSLRAYLTAAQSGVALQVSPRGVGPDFKYPQVNKIKTATNGKSAEYIAKPEELKADFAHLIEAATRNAVTDVRLNVWMPNVVELLEVKQTLPTLGESMMGKQTVDRTAGQTHSFALGAMGSEPLEYFIRKKLQPKPIGQQASAGKVFISYVLNGKRIETAPCIEKCEWTPENDTRSTRIAAGVARAKGNVEMAQNIQEGLRALENGDTATATQKLGVAAKLAAAKGDTEMTQKIAAIAVIEDAASGTVRLKKGAKDDKDATLKLESLTQKTVRTVTV